MKLQDNFLFFSYKQPIKLFIIVVIFFVTTLNVEICSLSKSIESCHLRELELCAVGAAAMFQNPNGVPISQTELKRQCEYLNESIDCFEDYADNCLTKLQGSMLSLFGHDIGTIQREFCDESTQLRQNYTKLAPCLRNIQRKYQFECVSDLQAGFESIHKLNISTRLSTLCCNVNRFKGCILDKIDDECGSDAYDFVMSVIRRVASNAIGLLCRNYDTDFEGCNVFLPKPGTKPHAGRNTSAISRIISGYANAKA